MSDDHVTQRQLYEYVDGQLESTKAEAVERHLAGCAGCAEQVEALDTLLEELASLPGSSQFNPEFDPNTYSNRIIDLIIPFVVGRGGITQDEAEAWAADLRERGQNVDYFFSLNRYFFLATKL